MPTNVNRSPFPLGQIKPGGTTSCVLITANYTDLANLFADSVVVQALPGNSANMYICSNASAPDTTNYTNILFVLPPGAFWSDASAAMNTIALGTIYVGASNSSDSCIAQARFR